MDDVVVERVVECLESALEHLPIAGGTGNEVGEAWRRRKGRDGKGAELRLDKDGRGSGGGAVEREEESDVWRGKGCEE